MPVAPLLLWQPKVSLDIAKYIPLVAELPSVESHWVGGIFWKTCWFCHLESANRDELLLCYKGHLPKYRTVISLGPDGAKRSLYPCVFLRIAKKASVHFEWYRWSPGKEAPALSPANCFSLFLLSIWPSLWLVKYLLNLLKLCDCGLRRKDLCSLEGIIVPELGNWLN